MYENKACNVRGERPNAIFIAVDDAFEEQTKLFFRSIQANWKDHPLIMVMFNGKNCNAKRFITRQSNVRLLDREIAHLITGPVMQHLEGKVDARTFYARCTLWSEAFSEFNNILHLDVDTLVLEPLDELMSEKTFTMFTEEQITPDFIFTDHEDPGLIQQLAMDGITVDPYRANAGVFLMPPQYRCASEYEGICGLLDRYGKYLRWADQSLINLWMIKERIATSPNVEWNFQIRTIRPSYLDFQKAKILHFNGVPDPFRIQLMKLALDMLEEGVGKYDVAKFLSGAYQSSRKQMHTNLKKAA